MKICYDMENKGKFKVIGDSNNVIATERGSKRGESVIKLSFIWILALSIPKPR